MTTAPNECMSEGSAGPRRLRAAACVMQFYIYSRVLQTVDEPRTCNAGCLARTKMTPLGVHESAGQELQLGGVDRSTHSRAWLLS